MGRTRFCASILLCFNTLCCLSSIPLPVHTQDRRFRIYLQREQFLCRHLPANNVKEHTRGNLCFCPDSQKRACTAMTPRSAPSKPAASCRKRKQPVPRFPQHPSCPEQRSHSPTFLQGASCSLCPWQKQFLPNQKVCYGSTLTAHGVNKGKTKFLPKCLGERPKAGPRTNGCANPTP